MIEDAVYSLLKNSSAVAAIVSARIYPTRLPQNCTMPAISYHKISTAPRALAQDGPIGNAETFFQISCWAVDPRSGKSLASAVRSLLSGYKGTVGSEVINVIRVENQLEASALEDVQFHEALTINVNHKET